MEAERRSVFGTKRRVGDVDPYADVVLYPVGTVYD
jgi:hypothetical protein